jgi:hypothetical protein
MAFFYSQGTAVKDYTNLSILVSVIDFDIFSNLDSTKTFSHFGKKYNLALNLVDKDTDPSK